MTPPRVVLAVLLLAIGGILVELTVPRPSWGLIALGAVTFAVGAAIPLALRSALQRRRKQERWLTDDELLRRQDAA